MFKKLLLKTLKSLTPEEKNVIRGFLEDSNEVNSENEKQDDKDDVDEEKSEFTEKENEEGEHETMNQDKTKQDVELETDDGKKKEITELTNETDVEDNKSKSNESEALENEQQSNIAQVNQTDDSQRNGVRVEDLVTKDELMERLSAMEAKFESVVKENKDLKDKYENKDFGNMQRQGMLPKDRQANSCFDDYSKTFM